MLEKRTSRFFYGYVVVVASLFVSLLMVGTYHSFGIFFKPLTAELGWTRAVTAGARSIAQLLRGFLGIIAGRLTDKFGPRVVLIGCGLFLGLGYLLMSQVNSVWQLYLFYGLIVGIGASGIDTPVLATIARWFSKRRGTITGIVKTGGGIGILSIPLLVNWLILSDSWRSAYATIGLITIIGVTVAALFLKRDPAQVGQLPDGAQKIMGIDLSVDARQLSLRDVLSTRQFWIMSAVWFSVSFSLQIVLVHTAPHVSDLGISTTSAATVVSMIGGFSIIGRLGLGVVSDLLGKKLTFIIALLSLAASIMVILYAREMWVFYVFTFLYGVAHGSFFTLISPMLAELFGLGSLGAILGAVMFVGTFGGSVSPVLAGRIFDATGSYRIAFLLCLALSMVAIILLFFLKPVKHPVLGNVRN